MRCTRSSPDRDVEYRGFIGSSGHALTLKVSYLVQYSPAGILPIANRVRRAEAYPVKAQHSVGEHPATSEVSTVFAAAPQTTRR
jgi:hypothetical protein